MVSISARWPASTRRPTPRADRSCYRVDQVAEVPTQPVELPDDELVALPQGLADEGCKIPLPWPGGARTLTPREPGREPNRQTFWFGAELDPDGSQVWFRITSEAVRRMREGDAVARGERLVDALLAWLTPARRLGPEVNRFPGSGLR